MEVGRANEVDSAKHLYLNRSDQSHANCRTSELQSFVGREDSRWRGEKELAERKGAEGDPNVTTLIEIRARNIIKHEGSFRDDVSTMGKIRPSWLSLARQ